MTSAIADHMGLDLDVNRGELEELKQHVMPETVLDKLDDLKPSSSKVTKMCGVSDPRVRAAYRAGCRRQVNHRLA